MPATLSLPKAAQQILAMPGVESLEREPDGWCCHLRYGWSTDALDGGGTVIDRSLATIRDHVKGARPWPLEEEKEEAPAPARNPRRIGYGRVSTLTQTEETQRAALEAAGCDEIHTETISSGKKERPVLAQVMRELQPGDTLVICKLDRWARSLKELLVMAAELQERGVTLYVIDQAIDSSTPTGRLLFHVLGAIAEFERELGIQRTRESIAHRRATGGDLGGRRKSYKPEQAEMAVRLRGEGESFRSIARKLGLSLATVQRILEAG
jgi:DNA invertase Pin-like site-specific DNA recombinase